jgi:hypothetical protein
MAVIEYLLQAISHQPRKEKKGKWANGEKEKTKNRSSSFPFPLFPFCPSSHLALSLFLKLTAFYL